MKLYRARIPSIASGVVERLCIEGDIEVEPADREEAAADLVAIMDMYLRRDAELREAVREKMDAENIPFDEYARARSEVASSMNHPLGHQVESYLARQFIENFMISRFVGEVYTDDRTLFNKVKTLVKGFDVDESALRTEAEDRIKNIDRGSVEYQDALQRALKEVRKRHGLG